ncbi:MAG TPA: PTS sugar transporter subunit IIA [Thermodesulfobacteriota bacterium]|nr:PTS sugar transporter subunit IIA [Thermodesulfobacteriota bacterium]HNU73177.1 PTS sugar transporter subunit IIA [Thermodesulfobacteriota bacterium]HOC39632.1 PTS sugar transporter subunit IIA [Thermodesulfobacteriota bacterium]
MDHKEFLKVFDQDLFVSEFRSTAKREVFKEIAECLEKSSRVFEGKIIVDLLEKREQLGTTAIGKGVAIPHCRSMATDTLTAVVGVSEEGIDFDAPDNQPVKLIFVILAPPQDVNYLPFLGRLIEFIRDDTIRKRLLRVKSFKGLKKVFTEYMKNE